MDVQYRNERSKQEPGHFYPNITKLSKAIGWKPVYTLKEGITKTYKFYKLNSKHYW